MRFVIAQSTCGRWFARAARNRVPAGDQAQGQRVTDNTKKDADETMTAPTVVKGSSPS